MTRRLAVLFAIVAGSAVGNLYWAQPLLDLIARQLRTDPATAGWLVTTTQLGYALGVLLIVPLGDLVDRHRLVPIALAGAAVALGASALAPTFPVLAVTLALVGVTTVSGQILVPLAGDLADDADRGRIVGTVVSGILIGILLSRTVSGFVAGLLGWRAIYLVAAVVSLLLAALLARALPVLPPRTRLAYPALIGSVLRIVARERVVRWNLVLGGVSFSVFTMFWTALTFLLAAPPFSLPVGTIGLFGLVGLAGAIAAQRAGRLHDRGLGLVTIGVAWALVLVAFVIGGLGAHSVPLLVIAILVLDVAIQGHNITVQTRMFQVDPAARSRLNTAFVANNFLWGAVGSGLTAVLWHLGGWTAVCIAGAVLSGFAWTVWAVGRRGGLRIAAPPGNDPSPRAVAPGGRTAPPIDIDVKES